jgi:hypothetical protein
MKVLPISARMTVNSGATGNTIETLCSIIRKRSTKKDILFDIKKGKC